MYVIPAIDIRKGRAVRLVQGDLRDETVYSQEPVSVAKLWKLKGAKRLHVIDLDGAFSGKLSNLEYVKEIIKATDFKVQMGGGIRDLKTIEKVILALIIKAKMNFWQAPEGTQNCANSVAMAHFPRTWRRFRGALGLN